jgi:hypothetical protein
MVHVCCDGFDSAKFHSSREKVLSSFLPADFSMLLFGGGPSPRPSALRNANYFRPPRPHHIFSFPA